jgi:hypothetical protein
MRKTIIAASAVGALLLAASAAAQAAPLPPTDLPAGVDLFKANAPVHAGEDASLTRGDTEYTLGALEGAVDMLAAPCAGALAADASLGLNDSACTDPAGTAWGQADFALASPPDPARAGDFGQVRLRLHQLQDGTFEVRLQTETSPSGGALDLVSGEPVTIETTPPEATDIKVFPPVGQQYTLAEPVPLSSTGSVTEEQDGIVEFTVFVGWLAA